MKRDKLFGEFENESEQVKSIIRDQPPFNWEYLLAAELLHSRLLNISEQYDRLKTGVLNKRCNFLNEDKYIEWQVSLCDEMSEIPELLGNAIIKDLQKSFGPPGKHGSALKIKNAVERISNLCQRLVRIETDIRSILPPNRFIMLHKKMEGLTYSWFNKILKFKDDLKEFAIEIGKPDASGNYNININFDTPSQIEFMRNEIKKIKSLNPRTTRTKSSSELRRELFGEPQINVPKSHPKKKNHVKRS